MAKFYNHFIRVSITMTEVRKKQIIQVRESHQTGTRTEGRKDGQTPFY